jgi:hypothetical protein
MSDSLDLFRGTAPKCEATWFDRLKTEVRWTLGSILNLFRIPGLVKPMRAYDRLTNTQIRIAVNHLFTVISIDGNDYYFRRLDGKYDGSGKRAECD